MKNIEFKAIWSQSIMWQPVWLNSQNLLKFVWLKNKENYIYFTSFSGVWFIKNINEYVNKKFLSSLSPSTSNMCYPIMMWYPWEL